MDAVRGDRRLGARDLCLAASVGGAFTSVTEARFTFSLVSITNKRHMTTQLKNIIKAHLPVRVASRRILSGPLKGKKLVTSWRDYPTGILGTAERPLLSWLTANVQPGEVWLYIGANCGYTTIHIASVVGREGRIFAFEPVPDLAGKLLATARANGMAQIVVVPLALGETPILRCRSTAIFSGMADPTTEPEPDSPRILEIALDALWPQLWEPRSHVAGLKVDVNGSEMSVLRGMRTVLTSHRPKLALEIHQCVDRNDLLTFLREVGYLWTGNIDPSPPDVLLNDHNYECTPDKLASC